VGLVKATGILPHLAYQFLVKAREQNLREQIVHQGKPVSSIPSLMALTCEAAYALSLEQPPTVYMVEAPGPPNAFTFGSNEAPLIVVDRRLMEGVGSGELRALLGHEMGHVKSGNMLYHTMAQTLAEGVRLSASFMGVNAISMPMQLALLAWQRESELSADRAGLLASGSPSHVVSMLARLAGNSGSFGENASILDNIGQLFGTHPNLTARARAVVEFAKTEEYTNLVNRVVFRRDYRLAYTPMCRFCNAAKPIQDLFCPKCGKSQA
jgi:Zn-dependent protease with chaperone function